MTDESPCPTPRMPGAPEPGPLGPGEMADSLADPLADELPESLAGPQAAPLADALPVPQEGAPGDVLAVPQDDDFYSPKDSGLPPLPCLGCGWCCLDNPCEVSHQAFGYAKRCPALVWTGARYICDLVVHPVAGVDLSPLFVGQGCCARHNAWREDVKERG